MHRKMTLSLILILMSALTARAADEVAGPKELSGMSIVGNDEAPKSLYIVPWKSSEIGVKTSMSMMLNDLDVPVDRDVFMRQLDFYEISTTNNHRRKK